MFNVNNLRDNVFVFYDPEQWIKEAYKEGESVSPGGIVSKFGISRQHLNNLIHRDGKVKAYYYVDPSNKRKNGVVKSAYCLIPLNQFDKELIAK